MRLSWTLTSKLLVTGVSFLLLALLSIGLTVWVSWELEGGAAAVNEAGRLRMHTYRLALSMERPSQADMREIATRFDQSLELLRTGDPSRPLFVPWSAESREHFDDIRREWPLLRDRWLSEAAIDSDTLKQADAFSGRIERFVRSIEEELARYTTFLHIFQQAMMALVIASAVALLYAGNMMILAPLGQLMKAVTALREGDLSARVKVDRQDEFGALSEGFNDMALTLQSLYMRLEDRVREKTAKLEDQRRRLTDLYEVSAFTARATQLESLAQGFAERLRHVARADATAVRWSNEDNGRYVLLASDGLPEDLVNDEMCLDAGSCHCAPAVDETGFRAIPILPETPAPLNHCARAGFHMVVSIPLQLHERVLGEVNLFFFDPVEISKEDRGLLDTLVSHLAGAMEGLRLAAFEKESAVAQERSLIARELHDSIAQSLAFLKIQVQLLRDAFARGDQAAVAPIIEELDTGVRESYADVRELLLHFRTRTSEESIEPALRTTLSKFEHQTGLATQLTIEARGIALPPDVQVQVLHIVQEALSNVRKHARASRVSVNVRSSPNWRFEIRDDGLGFDAALGPPGDSHVGLRIMRERAERIGAQVTVQSQPNAGSIVTLELPALPVADALPQTEHAL